MVVFVDLDEEREDLGIPYRHANYPSRHEDKNQLRQYPSDGFMSRSWPSPESGTQSGKPLVNDREGQGNEGNEEFRDNASPFAAALGCYPVVKSLTQWLDLNTLFSLSLTCRQFRANLLQFRSQLVRQTLRCHWDHSPLLSEILEARNTVNAVGEARELLASGAFCLSANNLSLAPKVGPCARDLVGDCRRCGKTVCRNCTMKPPANPLLKDRIRRLCTTCQEVPLVWHTSGMAPEECQRRLSLHDFEEEKQAFTSTAFSREPCNCDTSVWLCQTCGQGLRAADVNYKRVWTWRSRYSTHIGGLGTGIGEGNQGQKCGRDNECLAAKDHEVEIDCSADDIDHLQSDSSCPPMLERKASYDHEPGYFRQEIEGIGGVVKKKVKKRVRIGATVTEYDDERETGKYLERETQGLDRAWCSWCQRVVPGKRDLPSDI